MTFYFPWKISASERSLFLPAKKYEEDRAMMGARIRGTTSQLKFGLQQSRVVWGRQCCCASKRLPRRLPQWLPGSGLRADSVWTEQAGWLPLNTGVS